MILFILFLILAICAPWVLFLTGVAVGLFLIPFMVFFGVWIAVAWLILLLLPAFFWIGIAAGLVLAIGAARFILGVTKRHNRSRLESGTVVATPPEPGTRPS